ncbi:Uncharacterized protein OBRU01_02301 [Operophtera brumata]|uniref:Uncharacterized protein n=1 Tax=Operophtera brumata TaxID=104452 RepID=A0A0L7LSM5_OPEBR|nr:Uncharacterized protein OBRU01_02301 [Operophtera brumata]
MSSSFNSSNEEVPVVEVVFTNTLDSSSEEPPREEWSSLLFEIPDENIKRIKYAENLYDPGSGEICPKYIPLSASSVFRHPFYNYPGVTDPGIINALLHPIPKILYTDDGQELYLALCKEMGICPVRCFYRNLLEDTINLNYYGVNPAGFRAIAMALKLNRYVKVLDLTDNWINEDGCFHLGEMFVSNITLTELNLTGCRIGPGGARQLCINLPLNRSLKTLNLSKNQLGDQGVEYLSFAVFKGADVTNVNLSYNSLSPKCILRLAEVFETNNKFTHLDLSWNFILSANAIYSLCQCLSANPNFEELNLSWNSLSGKRIGLAMKNLLKNPNIRKLILTKNKLEGPAIKAIGANLSKAKKLQTLDLSYNPLTPVDAMNLLLRLKARDVKLQNLIMEDVFVSLEFLEVREEILKLKYRKNTVITYGGIKASFKSVGTDMREIVLNRAAAIGNQSKKAPKDFALIILQLFKLDKQPMEFKLFTRTMRSLGMNLDDDLLQEILNQFRGPRTEKTFSINMAALHDYVKRKWPDKKLPPTPPPEIVVPDPPKKGKKDKKGKKGK